jgi:SAM-dependent methyltransferase
MRSLSVASREARPYYDHEELWRAIASRGGRAWDDIQGRPVADSFAGFRRFLATEAASPRGPDALAVDIGCGGGQAALELRRRGFRVIAVDLSPTAIEVARRNADEAALEVQLVVDDALSLAAIPDEAVDLAVENHVLHCLVTPADREAFLATIRRVLKPGGLLFSETMSAEGDFDPSRVRAEPVSRVSTDGRRIWVLRRELERELATAGFSIIAQYASPDDPGAGTLLATVARREADPARAHALEEVP